MKVYIYLNVTARLFMPLTITGFNMKKLILILSGAILSVSTYADKPLQVQHGEPMPLGEPATYKEPVKYSYTESSTGVQSDHVNSFNIAYMGAKLGSSDLGGDENFNGVDLGFTSFYEKWVVGFGYTYLNSSEWDASQIYSKLGYKVFDQNNTYGLASFGVGYSWASAKDIDLKLEYFTVPVDLEIGHYVNNNMAFYGSLGYQWLSNTSAKVCIGSICASDSSSEFDIDGVTYKLGLRYKF